MVEGNELRELAKNIDISDLSTEKAGGFVGCTVGIYAEDIESRSDKVRALFKSFSYKRITRDSIKKAEEAKAQDKE